ncbi:efflux RND transporter periplasmic adaptor subunit [Vineibacter terrae]|uniref:Efflux RND transporter periplasmic adaptor subunit n=1 Tax=Vineibacter terrae TaxID=2586908 RepID=A0A5C8PTH5_9HYPH|nr:efflux RND transporter periplasmic adaptor subunit [Vineibacter terrae]TXL80382.1 efflux RND transporter periplasmic adaptor subunit [Vineibacter terrae]
MRARTLLFAATIALAGIGAGAAGAYFAMNRQVPASDAATPPPEAGGRKILYYRNPMGAPDTSPVPKQDSMGMDYLPVYEGEEPPDDSGTVTLSPQRIQRLGVRSEMVERRMLTRPVRATGTVQFDERRQTIVALLFEGWIERLVASATGDKVRRGEALATIYSPALLLAEQEYVLTRKSTSTVAGLEAVALQRLRVLRVPEPEVERLRRGGEPRSMVDIPAPADGVVLEKPAILGMRVTPGDMLFKLVDLASVWVIADVPETGLADIRVGQAASIATAAYPDASFTGTVGYIYPAVARETRTVRVRIELPNPEERLKADMLARVEIMTGESAAAVPAVPESAVIDSGTRRVVLVDKGEGRFEPRAVKLGRRAGAYYPVVEGVAEGERVVVSATFLIDSESNLRAALKSFTPPKSE